jgi:hypothetical protein
MNRESFDDHLVDEPENNGLLGRFVTAVQAQQPVGGLTHNFYRYPARFSPQFARAAIEAFSRPGDVILDPFMGGATALVEARAFGRHAVGSDVSSLSVFLGRVKTTPLSGDDLAHVSNWVWELPEHLNLHLPPVRAISWAKAGYQRNLPWPMRKLIELALARIHLLPRKRQQRFARCILLRVGQWALDCRERIPSAAEFRYELFSCLDSFTEGMQEFRKAVQDYPAPGHSSALTISIHSPAAELPAHAKMFDILPKRPTLVVTSPPYPGVYVLYHRWKVRGRRESAAPFWVADCQDGQGQAHYCFGHRKQRGLTKYFNGIRECFAGVRQVIDPSALVVQMVAFSEPDWQIPRFLEAMQEAGFDEVSPESLGIPAAGRLWRTVPGRRWFALIQGELATSQEVVLFHRPR